MAKRCCYLVSIRIDLAAEEEQQKRKQIVEAHKYTLMHKHKLRPTDTHTRDTRHEHVWPIFPVFFTMQF